MATKKQKRLAGEKRQAENRAESIRLGLLAQQRDREARARKQAALEEEALREKKRSRAKTGTQLVAMATQSNGES